MNSAIKPDFFNNLPEAVKQEQLKNVPAGDEEKHLYNLSTHKGYRILKEYTEGLLRDLDVVTTTAMSQGLSFEEIGRNAVVADLAKGIIKKILNKVEDAKEAIERPDGTLRGDK